MTNDSLEALDYPSESGERLVEIGFSTLLGEDDAAACGDAVGPWCVDHGAAMECLTTLELWMALAAGKVSPETKVWRDGRPCWLPIALVPELTIEPPEDLARELEQRSSIPVPLCREASEEPVGAPRPRMSVRALVVAASVVAALSAAIGLAWPAPEPPPARRGLVDLAEHSRALARHATRKALATPPHLSH